MHTRHVAASVLALIAVFAAARTPRMQIRPAVVYEIRDLGTLGGDTTAVALTPEASLFGVDDFNAYAAGYSRTAGGSEHAFLYHGGALQDLGTLGGSVSRATAVNLLGDAVGWSKNRAGVDRAFRFSNGTMQDLGSLSGAGRSFARSININGDIVGGSQTTGDVSSTRAFIYRGGTMALLGESLGGTLSAGNDVNNFGDVAGYAYTAGNGAYHAFVLQNGQTIDIGTLGGANSEALAVNERRQVVGRSGVAGSARQHAFLYSHGTLVDLGTLGGAHSEARDINNDGVAVGRSQIAGSVAYHAVMWRDGRITDLNTLLPPGTGWVLEGATAVSRSGQIVGYGLLDGRRRAFVMTPPLDLAVSSVGFEDFTSNLPRPVQAGRMVTWVYFLSPANDVPGEATNITVTDTLEGPVEYVSTDIFKRDGGCTITGRQLVCRFRRITADESGAFWLARVRTTGAGEFGHIARITASDQADPNPDNDFESETNTAISVARIAVTPAALAGGRAAGVQVTLTSPHVHGATVRMTSSNPAVVAVKDPFIVLDSTRSFNIVPAVVSVPTPVQISASYGLVTTTTTVTVLPPAIDALYLTPTTVIGGCGSVSAKVRLTGAAPASGAAVAISEAIPAALFPRTLVVPAGAITHTFTAPTNHVTSYQTGVVTAAYGGASKAVTLTVRPIRARTLALHPNPVVGGNPVIGVVTLECAAASVPVVVSLSSNNPGVATPTTSAITIPAGAGTGTFTVRTLPVAAPASASIRATVFGTRSTATLAVTPR